MKKPINYVIARHQEGITINPPEFVRDQKNNIILFYTKAGALSYYNQVTGSDETLSTLENKGIHIIENQ